VTFQQNIAKIRSSGAASAVRSPNVGFENTLKIQNPLFSQMGTEDVSLSGNFAALVQ
jgi:hypothetical protein